MTTKVTIDRLSIKDHKRYAEDQKQTDPIFLADTRVVPYLSEITGTSPIYSSEWEELFGIRKQVTWANFCSYPGYSDQAKRFFGTQILPTVDCKTSDEAPKLQTVEVIEGAMEKFKDGREALQQYMTESTTLINVLAVGTLLQSLLDLAHSCKLQFTKA
jgi:hypothetical protein